MPGRVAVTDVTRVTLAGGPKGGTGFAQPTVQCGRCKNYKNTGQGSGECTELGWQVNQDDESACQEFLAINPPARAAGQP